MGRRMRMTQGMPSVRDTRPRLSELRPSQGIFPDAPDVDHRAALTPYDDEAGLKEQACEDEGAFGDDDF